MTCYESWSIGLSFATFVAVVVTAVIYYKILLEMRNDIAQSSEHNRRNRTLDLSMEFWSPAMIGHRNRLWKQIPDILGVPRTSETDARAPLVRFYDEKGAEDQLWIDFLIVQGFFLKTAKQAKRDRLDQGICEDQFGHQFRRFYRELFRPSLKEALDASGWEEVADDYRFMADWLQSEHHPNARKTE